MPSERPPLTDRAALARNRARARGDALFLHHEARAEVEDRVSLVNRTFTDPAVVTGHPSVWGLPGAKVVPDDETLDLAPGAHDLVVHAMALHWADDPLGQIIQCRRALRPDGLFLAVFLGGGTLAALRAALATAETRLTGGLSPRIAPMAEIRDMGALLQRAGLALPVADVDRRTVAYGDGLALMRDLRAMGEGNALAARRRRIPPRALFAEADARLPRKDGRVETAFEMIHLAGLALPVADVDRRTVAYGDGLALMRDLRAMGEGNALAARRRRIPPRALFAEADALLPRRDGRVETAFEMIHLAGFAPSGDQPKPLRPGSATHRLADALGAAETKLRD